MSMRFLAPVTVAVVCAAALLAPPLHAQTPSQSAPKVAAPSAVETCSACHGPQGVSVSPTFPNLAGQKAAYLENQLKAFRAKERKNPFMNAIAPQLSDQDIKDLAAYWSSLPATPAPDPHMAETKAGPAIPSRMTMPRGFPAGFALYQNDAGDGALTERYANTIAWTAARSGQPLPAGSILFQVSYKLEKDASGKDMKGAITGYSGMESRAGWGASVPTLLRNGDWDYAVFAADGTRRDQLNQATCLACHKPQAASSYTFTLDKLREAAAAKK